MEKQISKRLMCIFIRGGLEIWAEEDKIKNLQQILRTVGKESKFIELEGETINTADITGIFYAKTMEDLTRRKNGMWKCRWNYWHNRGEQCACDDLEKYKVIIQPC